jgi:hypothetical protein
LSDGWGKAFLACGKGEGNLGKIPFLSGGCLASSKLLVVVVVVIGFLWFLDILVFCCLRA